MWLAGVPRSDEVGASDARPVREEISMRVGRISRSWREFVSDGSTLGAAGAGSSRLDNSTLTRLSPWKVLVADLKAFEEDANRVLSEAEQSEAPRGRYCRFRAKMQNKGLFMLCGLALSSRIKRGRVTGRFAKKISQRSVVIAGKLARARATGRRANSAAAADSATRQQHAQQGLHPGRPWSKRKERPRALRRTRQSATRSLSSASVQR